MSSYNATPSFPFPPVMQTDFANQVYAPPPVINSLSYNDNLMSYNPQMFSEPQPQLQPSQQFVDQQAEFLDLTYMNYLLSQQIVQQHEELLQQQQMQGIPPSMSTFQPSLAPLHRL
ncbi:unnamed protein product [Didymodactylos carnosus]|uniref:Uncharacterized protein n=3 Tax=Didymodactylos carnosus TaxID=1234261 RepID=A0A8S2G3Y3_9BILA|nr:unnamed protein product [Didymodactylos carnosus]CAF4445754.1 unnamed protein product [Didymodactylos carnosus]